MLAHNAVHAAFAGYTGVVTGLVNTHYVLLPIPVVISSPRRVRPGSANRLLALKSGVPHDRVPCPDGTHNQTPAASLCLHCQLALVVKMLYDLPECNPHEAESSLVM